MRDYLLLRVRPLSSFLLSFTVQLLFCTKSL
jgi:hypothetical protein